MSRVVQIPACTAGGVHIRTVALSDDRAAVGGVVLNAAFLRFAAHLGVHAALVPTLPGPDEG